MARGPRLPGALKNELGVKDDRRHKKIPPRDQEPRKKRKLYQPAPESSLAPESIPHKSILKKEKDSRLSKTRDDVLMEQDDAEIDYWEAKLGQKRAAVEDELGDGLDDIFDGLSLPRGSSRLEEVVVEPKRPRRQAREDEFETYEDEIGSDDSEQSMSSVPDLVIPEDDFTQFGTERDEDQEMSSGDVFLSTKPSKPSIYRPYAEEDPALHTVVEKPAAYVPPAMRRRQSGADQSQIGRQLKGLLNRLSAVNIATIVNELEAMYRSNPRGTMNDELSNLIMDVVSDKSSLLDTFVVLHAALLAALYKLNGTDFAASFVQKTVEAILAVPSEDIAIGRKAINLITLLSEMYNLNIIAAMLPYDFIRSSISDLNEVNIEILLVIVRSSGTQLRSDDPSALKAILNLLQAQMKAQYMEREIDVPLRMKFMVDTLMNLKNNKLTNAEGQQAKELRTRMKKYIGGLSSKVSAEPLRVSLDDIKNVNVRGKWWLVGASWKNAEPTDSSLEKVHHAPITNQQDELLALARQHRLNNPVRKQIFITILSASDYLEAITGVLSLRLKKSQESEISRVLLLLVASEERYNPYYTYIAKGLSERHGMRISLQFCLWDFLRDCGEDEVGQIGEHRDTEDDTDEGVPNTRKIINVGKFYGTLLGMQVLPITVLKTLTFSRLQGLTKRFLEIMFTELILTVSRNTKKTSEAEKKLTEIFRRVKTFDESQKNSSLKDGIDWFLRKQVSKCSVVSDDERALLEDGVDTARTILSL